MSTPEQDLDQDATGSTATTATEEPKPTEEPKRKLDLVVEVTDVGPCKKHIKVDVSRPDVDHQFDEALRDLRREASVPGFRVGRAPRKLVERRFRKEVAGQVKSQLVMATLEQIEEDHKINAITQPELDIDAIEIPEAGPMHFEMEVEVRPEFELPESKDLTVQKPVREITEADVEAQFKGFLERYAQIVPKLEGGAERGDLVVADLTFEMGGIRLNVVKESQFRVLPELRFQDGYVSDLETILLGANPGDVRSGHAHIGTSCPDPAIRGKTIDVHILVQDLKLYRLPEVDAEFLRSIGFDSEAELREALRALLVRRFAFHQRQAVRKALLDQMLGQVKIDLPADLVSRQEKSTVRRMVNEFRESGLSDNEIRAREAEIRANAHEKTLRGLKEFFLLSKVAEAEELKVEPEDLEQEIEAIASRTDESVRRIRARIEKEGTLELLATQIIERKALDRLLEKVTVVEVPLVVGEEKGVDTIDQSAGSAPDEGEGQGEPKTD